MTPLHCHQEYIRAKEYIKILNDKASFGRLSKNEIKEAVELVVRVRKYEQFKFKKR